MAGGRYRIVIRCLQCGEKYILRGRRNKNGEFETGFIRCICGSEDELNIDLTPQ